MASSCTTNQFTKLIYGPQAAGTAGFHPSSTQDLTNQKLWGKGSQIGDKHLGDSGVQPRRRAHIPLNYSLPEASYTERQVPQAPVGPHSQQHSRTTYDPKKRKDRQFLVVVSCGQTVSVPLKDKA